MPVGGEASLEARGRDGGTEGKCLPEAHGEGLRRPAGGRWPLWRPEGGMEGEKDGGRAEGIAGERE